MSKTVIKASDFDINNISGLSSAEVARRLAEEGYNELPSVRRRSIFKIALGVAREPMFLLLIASGIVYLLLGDVREALILLSFVFRHHGYHSLSGAQDRAYA